MLKKTLLLCILALGTLLAAACANMAPPLANPADAALNRAVTEAIGDYTRTVNTTTVGGRVYLEGWVPNSAEREEVIALAKEVPGVTEVVEDLHLEEVGSLDGGWE
ncbi:BON domain-containing protein [Desulfovibrio sp. OttesenSCG-928-O18]|nr:BON domain-containing protein [Desulfovibrio sp. OttesenSCG-928-O18]